MTESEKLKEALKSFQRTEKFSPGDIIRWKSGLKNKVFPERDAIAIVVEHLETPIMDDEKSSSSSYFMEPLDLVVGIMHEGNFKTLYYNSRRFERAE